mmetsp:Transcript_1381/g.3675  ORF Transcript_1381/g.3675 Transcript_1381/m.3675 type:complete len:415 (-) Transcript_1381:794-2038(-)
MTAFQSDQGQMGLAPTMDVEGRGLARARGGRAKLRAPYARAREKGAEASLPQDDRELAEFLERVGEYCGRAFQLSDGELLDGASEGVTGAPRRTEDAGVGRFVQFLGALAQEAGRTPASPSRGGPAAGGNGGEEVEEVTARRSWDHEAFGRHVAAFLSGAAAVLEAYGAKLGPTSARHGTMCSLACAKLLLVTVYVAPAAGVAPDAVSAGSGGGSSVLDVIVTAASGVMPACAAVRYRLPAILLSYHRVLLSLDALSALRGAPVTPAAAQRRLLEAVLLRLVRAGCLDLLDVERGLAQLVRRAEEVGDALVLDRRLTALGDEGTYRRLTAALADARAELRALVGRLVRVLAVRHGGAAGQELCFSRLWSSGDSRWCFTPESLCEGLPGARVEAVGGVTPTRPGRPLAPTAEEPT